MSKDNRKSISELLIGCKGKFAMAMLLDLISAVSAAIASLMLTYFTQSVMDGKYMIAIEIELISLSIWIFNCIVDYLYQQKQNEVIQFAMNEYRKQISDSLCVNDTPDTARTLASLNSDTGRIEQGISNVFVMADAGLFSVIFSIALFYLHWELLVFALGMFVMNMLVPKFLKRKSEEAEKTGSDAQKGYLEKSKDLLDGFFVWNAYNQKQTLKDKLDTSGRWYEKKMRRIRNIQSGLSEIPRGVNITSQFLIIIFTVCLIMKGKVLAGTILSVGNICGDLFSNISNLISSSIKLSGYDSVYRERVQTEGRQERKNTELSDGTITVKNLKFGYDRNNLIFNNLSLRFEKGKKYLIYGTSGCGKSTLLRLLFKENDYSEGTITIGGVDYHNIDKEQLHRVIGFIPQSSYVFDETVKDNILLGRQEEENQLSESLRKAELDPIFVVDERSAKTLSGGQTQRVCLARELYEYHPILLMDEVANAVDEKMAADIYRLFLNSERTVIAVAHYLPDGIREQFDEVIEL